MRLWWLAFATLTVCSTVSFASSASQRDRGASVFADNGCMHCHTIRKRGGHRVPTFPALAEGFQKGGCAGKFLRAVG